MSRVFWASALLLVFVLAGGWFYIDRAGLGIPGFMVWRVVTSTAHGGEFVEVGPEADVRIYVETYGSGEPLLLLHGGFSNIETMHRQIRAFAEDRYVIAPDSRAHGRSSPIEGGLHYSDMAEDMIMLLDHLDLASADVFGWSDGGVIALDMAMRYPTRVRKVAVFGSNFHHDGLIVEEDDPLEKGPDAEELATVRMLYESLAQDPERWPLFYEKTRTMWSTEPEFTEGGLSGIVAPTLVMAGEHDMIKPDHLRALAAAIPDGRLEILPGDDHFAPMQNFAAVNARLKAFFAE